MVERSAPWAREIEGDMDQGKHYGFSRVRTLADAVDAFNRVEQGRERLSAENIETNPKKPARHRAPQTVRHCRCRRAWTIIHVHCAASRPKLKPSCMN